MKIAAEGIKATQIMKSVEAKKEEAGKDKKTLPEDNCEIEVEEEEKAPHLIWPSGGYRQTSMLDVPMCKLIVIVLHVSVSVYKSSLHG